jgi:hypothetical protein
VSRGFFSRSSLSFAAILAFTLLATTGFQAATASAEPAPYVGDMGFPSIQDPSGQEDYSWQVQLSEDQALEQIDDQTAIVYYAGDHVTALAITAEAAHDAVGTNVPTTLSVSGSNVITLTVHHRAGNPDAGGTPFDYPILAGPGWEGGIQPGVVVIGPPDEAELREERERRARAALEAERSGVALSGCLVPRLKGKSLRASKRRLARAGCGVGKVTLSRGAKRNQARVVGQSPRPGTALGSAANVNLALG